MQSSGFSKSISRVSWLEGQPASEAERSKSLGCEPKVVGSIPTLDGKLSVIFDLRVKWKIYLLDKQTMNIH